MDLRQKSPTMLNNKDIDILVFVVCEVPMYINMDVRRAKKPPVFRFCKNSTAAILAVKENWRRITKPTRQIIFKEPEVLCICGQKKIKSHKQNTKTKPKTHILLRVYCFSSLILSPVSSSLIILHLVKLQLGVMNPSTAEDTLQSISSLCSENSNSRSEPCCFSQCSHVGDTGCRPAGHRLQSRHCQQWLRKKRCGVTSSMEARTYKVVPMYEECRLSIISRNRRQNLKTSICFIMY